MKIFEPYIQVEIKEIKTKSGIVLPTQQEETNALQEFHVLKTYKDAKVKKGDVVALAPMTRILTHKNQKKDIVFINENDIMAVL